MNDEKIESVGLFTFGKYLISNIFIKCVIPNMVFMNIDKIVVQRSDIKESAGKWSEENNGKMLSRSYWLYLSNDYASIFFMYQSSHLISHGHRATELASSDCSRAELSS